MASYWTNRGKARIADKGVTGVSREFRILLVNTPPASGTAAADLNTVSQVVSGELSGTGYARKTLTSATVTEDDTNDWALFDAADPSTYTAINAGTIAGAWIYDRQTPGSDTDASDHLWMFLDLSPDLVTNGGDVTLQFNTNGLSTLA